MVLTSREKQAAHRARQKARDPIGYLKKMAEYQRAYNRRHPEIALKRTAERQRMRLDCLRHYSNGEMRCQCRQSPCWHEDQCAVTYEDVLELDHLNGGGNAHRRTLHPNTWFLHYIRDGYPPLFQTLCRNCNYIKEVNRRKGLRNLNKP